MAATQPAIDRINFITGHRTRPTYSPGTISGSTTEIYSYQLRIAHRDGNDWMVKTDADNSATTNRHIRAAHMAFGMTTKYTNVGVETVNGERYTRYQSNR